MLPPDPLWWPSSPNRWWCPVFQRNNCSCGKCLARVFQPEFQAGKNPKKAFNELDTVTFAAMGRTAPGPGNGEKG